MDAKVDTCILNDCIQDVDGCKDKLSDCIRTLHAEFRIMDMHLEGEQVEKFEENIRGFCSAIGEIIANLDSCESFLKDLESEINNYDRTKYQG